MTGFLEFSDGVKGSFFTITDPDGLHVVRLHADRPLHHQVTELFPRWTNCSPSWGQDMLQWMKAHPEVEVIGSVVTQPSSMVRR